MIFENNIKFFVYKNNTYDKSDTRSMVISGLRSCNISYTHHYQETCALDNVTGKSLFVPCNSDIDIKIYGFFKDKKSYHVLHTQCCSKEHIFISIESFDNDVLVKGMFFITYYEYIIDEQLDLYFKMHCKSFSL